MRSKRIKRIRLPNTASDDEGEPCMGVVSQIIDLDNSSSAVPYNSLTDSTSLKRAAALFTQQLRNLNRLFS